MGLMGPMEPMEMSSRAGESRHGHGRKLEERLRSFRPQSSEYINIFTTSLTRNFMYPRVGMLHKQRNRHPPYLPSSRSAKIHPLIFDCKLIAHGCNMHHQIIRASAEGVPMISARANSPWTKQGAFDRYALIKKLDCFKSSKQIR